MERVRINPTGANGKGKDPATGRFTRGNRFGRGNPNAKKQAELRGMLEETITPADLRAVLRRMIRDAKNGCRFARTELLDRLWGRPPQSVGVAILNDELDPDERFI